MDGSILKQAVARDFSRAAASYSSHAVLQAEVAERLLQWGGLSFEPRQIVLDAGCGSRPLNSGPAITIGLDIAADMCREAAESSPAILGDMELLPFRSESFHAAFSSMALQWLPQREKFFQEVLRVLRQDGTLLLAVPLAGSFIELRQAASSSGVTLNLLPLPYAGKLLVQAASLGLDLCSFQVKEHVTYHPDMLTLLRQFRQFGAQAKSGRGLRNPGDLKRLTAAYEETAEGLPLNWSIGYFHWKRP